MGPLFKPFRALGYVTDAVPFHVQRTPKEDMVFLAVGKTWQGLNCSKLQLILMGPQLGHSVNAIASTGELVFCACGSNIEVVKRLHRIGTCRSQGGKIIQLLALGEMVLSLASGSSLTVWRIDKLDEPQRMISLQNDFTPTCMVHPDTYINKVVIASEEGRLQVWNFSTGKMVFESSGWGAPVRCLASSPALDVLAVGLVDGRAILYNVRYEKVIHSFDNASGAGMNYNGSLGASLNADAKTPGAACTAIAFSTGIGVPVMAVGGASGVITVWHLEDKTLSTVIHAAHDGPVVSLFFFPATPILMSSSADNSIKQWIFDNADGSARLLKYRCGHRAPPNCIKFYGQGYRVLSGGQDRAFWMFSTNQAQQSRELSQGHTARKAKKRKVHEEQVKLSRVTHLDACEVRERDWANGITAHEGDWRAYTWRLKDFTIGEHALEPPSRHGGRSLRPSPVTCVHLSECGNFGFVGSANGRLHRFNMQSGLHRGEYKRRKDDAGLPAHDGAVTGVATDSCNRSVVSTSYDGWLRIWSFPSQVLRAQVHTGCPVSHLLLHPGTSMCPLVGDDLTIRVYDAEAARLVRKFRGHTDRITALEMSSDGRWLLSAAMDGSVRVWDVPAGQVLQVMQLGSAVTSLSLSPAMDILATTHVNRRGIYLWSNQLVFGTGASVVPSEEPVDVLLPTSFAGEGIVQPDDLPTVEEHRLEGPGTPDKPRILSGQEADNPRAPEPLASGLVTLSMLPRSKWHDLAHLDVIQARNKPIQPPEKPEAAPFFLPSLAGSSSNPIFDLSGMQGAGSDEGANTDDGEVIGAGSRLLRGAHAAVPEWVKLLRDCALRKDCSTFLEYLREQSPASIDREIRSLEVLPAGEPEGGGSEIGSNAAPQEVADLKLLLEFLGRQIESRENFEFMQAVLKLVLDVHGDAIMTWPALQSEAVRVKEQLVASWGRMEDLMLSVGCMVGYFSSLQG